MMKLFLLVSSLMLICLLFSQSVTQKSLIYSEKVKDSFELYISTPITFNSSKRYNVVYYCDANLNSGKKLRELIRSTMYKPKTDSTIFVGIGHIGNFHRLRQRDFSLPIITKNNDDGKSESQGKIENFYAFLKSELIPLINKKYRTNTHNNSIIGHSLGGLFVFYCLFKNDSYFRNYFALSPSLWIGHYSIYKFNQLPANAMEYKRLYFSTGSLETMNHIKKGTDEMENFLRQKKYQNLEYSYQVHKGSTHNSQVEKSLEFILKSAQ